MRRTRQLLESLVLLTAVTLGVLALPNSVAAGSGPVYCTCNSASGRVYIFTRDTPQSGIAEFAVGGTMTRAISSVNWYIDYVNNTTGRTGRLQGPGTVLSYSPTEWVGMPSSRPPVAASTGSGSWLSRATACIRRW